MGLLGGWVRLEPAQATRALWKGMTSCCPPHIIDCQCIFGPSRGAWKDCVCALRSIGMLFCLLLDSVHGQYIPCPPRICASRGLHIRARIRQHSAAPLQARADLASLGDKYGQHPWSTHSAYCSWAPRSRINSERCITILVSLKFCCAYG